MWWTLIFPICVSVALVMSLAFCLCWRKKTTKSEWQGLDGMVTQKNPDENVNHLPPTTALSPPDSTKANAGDHVDASKRSLPASSNTRRSLPDIPFEQGATVNWEPTGDNSSEHYATVEQYQNSKRHTIPNGIETRLSLSQHSSLSQADDSFSPYEKVKYDKINSKEHPYARVQPGTSRQQVPEESYNNPEERSSLLRSDGANSSNELSGLLRSRRSSTQSDHNGEIPAASAVAGGVTASSDLPYMTPPIAQQNFSGDSQDSSKGYTSISVREPLANILAQTKCMNKKKDLDPHYSTVSDDSDDVYTTIPDPNSQIYTSESETYARIPALPITVEVEVNRPPSGGSVGEGPSSAPLPPPPSVDSLKQAATSSSHSRQASSSSLTINLNSPKPEKRQANSPLPPPPTVSSNFDFHPPDKAQLMRNIDDLYAKVHKNKKKEEEPSPGDSPGRKRQSPRSKHRTYDEITPDHNYETLRKSNDPGYERIKSEEPGYASIKGPDSASGSDAGYEVLKNRAPSEADSNYEEVRERSTIDDDGDSSGYSKIKDNGGYSVVNKARKCDERDKSRASSNSYGTSNSQEISLEEPNYESMPSESTSDPNYAGIKSGSESDPNYESVKYLDEPPYERLDDSSKTDSDVCYERVSERGYENVDTSESSNGLVGINELDPPYEQLNNHDSDAPDYERIGDVSGSGTDDVSSGRSGAETGGGKSDDEPSVDFLTSKTRVDLLEDNAIFQV